MDAAVQQAIRIAMIETKHLVDYQRAVDGHPSLQRHFVTIPTTALVTFFEFAESQLKAMTGEG